MGKAEPSPRHLPSPSPLGRTASKHPGGDSQHEAPASILASLPLKDIVGRRISSQIMTEDVLMQEAIKGDSSDVGRIIPIYLL